MICGHPAVAVLSRHEAGSGRRHRWLPRGTTEVRRVLLRRVCRYAASSERAAESARPRTVRVAETTRRTGTTTLTASQRINILLRASPPRSAVLFVLIGCCGRSLRSRGILASRASPIQTSGARRTLALSRWHRGDTVGSNRLHHPAYCPLRHLQQHARATAQRHDPLSTARRSPSAPVQP